MQGIGGHSLRNHRIGRLPARAKRRRVASCSHDHAKVLTRADLPDSDKWDLTHLFTDADKWTEDFAWIQQHLSARSPIGRASRRVRRERSPHASNSRSRSIRKSSAFTTSLRSSSPRTAQIRNTSRAWAVAKSAHQNQRSRVVSWPGNPGDRRRKVRAVPGGPGARGVADRAEENPADETACSCPSPKNGCSRSAARRSMATTTRFRS